MKNLARCLLLLLGISHLLAARVQAQFPSDLDKVYADESHCLTSPEIRSDEDNPISCFCRDAIVEARYLYFTYVSIDAPHSDPNVATELCRRSLQSERR